MYNKAMRTTGSRRVQVGSQVNVNESLDAIRKVRNRGLSECVESKRCLEENMTMDNHDQSGARCCVIQDQFASRDLARLPFIRLN